MKDDDPRITAYALGELSGAERDAFEKELAETPELQKVIGEIRTTAEFLREGFGEEAADGGLTLAQKEAVLAGKGVSRGRDAVVVEVTFWRRARRHVLWAGAAAAAVLCVLLVVQQDEAIDGESRSAAETWSAGAPSPLEMADEAEVRTMSGKGNAGADRDEIATLAGRETEVRAKKADGTAGERVRGVEEVEMTVRVETESVTADSAPAAVAKMRASGRGMPVVDHFVTVPSSAGGAGTPPAVEGAETLESAAASSAGMVAAAAPEPSRDGRAIPRKAVANAAVAGETESGPNGSTTPMPAGSLSAKAVPREAIDAATKASVPPQPVAQAAEGQTRIQSGRGDRKNASGNSVIFDGGVTVDHADFEMRCDRIEIFLKKEGDFKKEKENEKARADATVVATTGGNWSGDIAKATATGAVVITKRGKGGVSQVGKCSEATYDEATGDVLMRGLPQLWRGVDRVIATGKDTTILLRAGGAMEVRGPIRTEMMKDGDAVPAAR